MPTQKTHNPVSGAGYLFRGFSLIFQPGLKRFVLIPIAINIVIYLVLFGMGYHYMAELIRWTDGFLPHWLQWLNWIIWPIFLIANMVFLLYTFTLFANIVSAPFNSFLSEKIELMETGKKYESGGWQEALKEMPRTLGREWAKLKYYLPRAVALLILSFIPGINAIASILWLIFGSWMMAIQYLDYPMDNHKVSFDEMIKALKSHGFSNLGFGACTLIASFIPILNFFAMPAAVAGATLKWLDHHKTE